MEFWSFRKPVFFVGMYSSPACSIVYTLYPTVYRTITPPPPLPPPSSSEASAPCFSPPPHRRRHGYAPTSTAAQSSQTITPIISPARIPQPERALTIESNLQTGSLGCAPTPSQYFARAVSSCISLIGFPPISSGGGFAMGS
jgi:hypothetical protein